MPSLLSRLLTPEAHDHAEADPSPPPSPPPARSLLRALLLGLAEPPVGAAAPSSPPPADDAERPLAEWPQMRRRASTATQMRERIADWAAEARRVAASAPVEYGNDAAGGAGTTYVLTGSSLWARARHDERRAVIAAFATNTRFTAVDATSAYVNDELAAAWAEVLTTNTTLTSLNLESNQIASAGVEALAGALRRNTTLRELKLASQFGSKPISQAAEEAMADALATNRTVTKLTLETKSTRARERIGRTLTANLDAHREARRDGDHSPAHSPAVRVADWAAEAKRVAASEPCEYANAAAAATSPPTLRTSAAAPAAEAVVYAMTNSSLWARARHDERSAVIAAFATNTRFTAVDATSAYVNDELAAAWAEVLTTNTTLTSLNLESNQIASAGVVALAAALRRNASLRELKLASQGQSISQAAEEALAEALASNSTITKLTLDTRSTRARDLLAKGLLANQERLRRERSSSAYTYVAVAGSPLGRRG